MFHASCQLKSQPQQAQTESPVCPSIVASQAGTSHFFHHFFSHSLEVLTSSSLNFGPFIFGFMLRPRGCFDWAFLWMTVSLLTHLSLSLWEPSQLLPPNSASHRRGKQRPPQVAWHRGGSSVTCCSAFTWWRGTLPKSTAGMLTTLTVLPRDLQHLLPSSH